MVLYICHRLKKTKFTPPLGKEAGCKFNYEQLCLCVDVFAHEGHTYFFLEVGLLDLNWHRSLCEYAAATVETGTCIGF